MTIRLRGDGQVLLAVVGREGEAKLVRGWGGGRAGEVGVDGEQKL